MKKIGKIFTTVLAVAVLTVFAGCSARSAVSADEFEKQAKSAGFTVTTPESDSSGAEKSLTATKGGSDAEVDFHQFSDASSAQSWYSEQKSALTSGSGKNVVDSDAYSKYTLTNGEIYYAIARIDNTVIYCKTTIANQSAADNLLNALHY
jgi:hypothetical protein